MLDTVSVALNAEEIAKYREIVQQVRVDDPIVEYIAKIVNATRNHPSLFLGASTRASLALLRTAKAAAATSGRDFVIPEDVISMTAPILRHRIMLTPEKEMEGITADALIENIVKSLEIPR